MILQLIQVLIIWKEFREILWLAERIQINEYRVAVYISRILNTKMVRVCEHGHNFFLHLICLVRKVDAVSKGFAHFGFAVNTWQTQACLVGRKHDLRLCKSLTVYGVEFVHDFLALLQHWKLILPNRNCRCAESGNICCLADRIAEKSYRNAGFKITLLISDFTVGLR